MKLQHPVAVCMTAALFGSPAKAEPVWLHMPNGQEGQGWMFRDAETGICAVITAAHVVRNADASNIVIVGERHTEAKVTGTRFLSPASGDGEENDLDVALLSIGGPLASAGCANAIVGSADLSIALGRSSEGVVQLIDPTGERVTQHVDYFVQSTLQPNVLGVRARPDFPIQQGESGAAILNAPADRTAPGATPTPLAMIVRVNTQYRPLAYAVRYDAIWHLVRLALPQLSNLVRTSNMSRGLNVASWAAQTLDPVCPVSNAVRSDLCAWRTAPLPGRSVLELVVDLGSSAATVSSFSLSVSRQDQRQGSQKVSVEVNPTGDQDGWSWVASCPEIDGLASCRFAQVNARQIRLTVADPDASPVGIRLIGVSK